MLINFLPFRNADDDTDPAGGESGKVRASDLRAQLGNQVDEQSLMRLLEKHAEVLSDNAQLRNQRRNLREEVSTLKGKVPADGSVILAADKAALLTAYEALGEPGQVKTALEQAAGALTELSSLKRLETIRAAAEAHGYKANALGKLPSLASAVITIKDEKENGKPIRRAYVTVDDKDIALPAYIEQHDPELLPALSSEKGAGDGVGSPAGGKRPNGKVELPSPGARF